MCGISGFTWRDETLGERMVKAMRHRGPDGEAVWSEEGITLGHNRLAIIDLDPRSLQPFHSLDQRYHMVYNGEIYNYKELKNELVAKGCIFRTESDTEVLLFGYAVWGADIFSRLRGMCACAIWDSETKEHVLARDHVGVKPLYYTENERGFIFSSELRGLRAHNLSFALSKEVLHTYFSLLFVPSPDTLISGVHKLRPGEWIKVRDGHVCEKERYYVPPRVSEGEYDHSGLRSYIETAVRRNLVSDRPVGLLLSGGLDSTVVLHHASGVGGVRDVFTAGFELKDSDVGEREKFNADLLLAKRTAAHYGVTHHAHMVSVHDVAETLEATLRALDEPISNPSSLALYHVASLARETVPVVLGGDGGDELFGGYDRHRYARLSSLYQRLVPRVLRPFLSEHSHVARKLGVPLGPEQYLSYLMQDTSRTKRLLREGYDPTPELHARFLPYFAEGDFLASFLRTDLMTWLPDESLIKADKLTMAHGVEGRVPLLDVDLVAYASRIPIADKVGFTEGKKVLRDAYRDVLPDYLFQEPKRGWISPGAKWLRYPEIEVVARNILSPTYYEGTSELFDWVAVDRMYEDHLARRSYNLYHLWALLTFQVWARSSQAEML